MAANQRITDIRVALSLPTNRKIRSLRRALGPGACWALLELWVYCGSNEQDGALIGWSAEDVEAAASWDGIPGEFVANTVRIGLLDELLAGGYEIHDWAENQPWVANAGTRSEAARRAITARWSRSKAESDTGRIRDEYGGNTDGIRSEIPHSPSTSTPTSTTTAVPTKRQRASKPAPLYRWDEFAAIYPSDKLTPDAKAKSIYRRKITDDASFDELMAGTMAWVQTRQYREGFGWGVCRYMEEEIWKRTPSEEARPMSKEARIRQHNQRVLDQIIAEEAANAGQN